MKSEKNDGTKQLIAQSIMELMLHQSIDSITVNAIVTPIGLTRQTFYNHFRDKYDLVDWIYRNHAVDFITLLGPDYTWIEAVIAKERIIQSNPTFYKKVYRQAWFIDSFTDITTQLYFDAVRKNAPNGITKELEFAIDFFVSACVKKTAEWVEGGCRESPEEIAINFLICIPEGLRKYLLNDADLAYIKSLGYTLPLDF